MSNAPISADRPALRRDLTSLVRRGHRRAYRIVVDEVSGRFARVSERGWQSLLSGAADDSLWRQADAAGWTRRRCELPRRSFNPLYLRLPLGSIDLIAKRLAPLSGWIFAPPAIVCWSALILLSGLLAVGQSRDIAGSLGSLPEFLKQSDPIWLGTIFVATKIMHELAHAVMCRRVGSRCGSVGVLLLCGMPCPYCDVTDVWRQESTSKRVAVMLAGIYVELILAALATCTWTIASDPTIRLHALNLMVVCGISTLVFNANPLMRYDGYFVLSDLIGSTNLRQAARDAFRGVFIKPIAGAGYAMPSRMDARSIGLAAFHLMSTAYRLVVLIAISATILHVADYFQIRPLAVAALLLAIAVFGIRAARQLASVAAGAGNWNRVPAWRRWGLLTGTGVLAGSILFVPLPRRRTATGWIDVADATSVYLAHDGTIVEVGFDFGDTVSSGDSLVQVKSDALKLQQAMLRGKLRLASLRRDLSRRVTLDRTDTAQQWSTLKAAEQAVADQLASVVRRIDKSNVKAPLGGVVVPPQPSLAAAAPLTLSLRRQIGTAADAYQPWCRISPAGALRAVLIVDSRDRSNINTGSPVNIAVASVPGTVFSSTIDSVSAIQTETKSIIRQSEYQVLCSLQTIEGPKVMQWLGQDCQAVFQLPPRSLAVDIAVWLQSWIGGESS